MDAVTAQFGGEIGPVVQDEGRAVRLDDGTQKIGGAADRIVFDVFESKLKARDITASQRLA
jgi:hypothetical protein